MKRQLISLLLMFILGAMNTEAQEWDHEYVPFVEEGKMWICNKSGNVIDCTFTMRGDTIIGNHTYKKVLCEFEKYYGDKTVHYYCGVREEDYRVFLIKPDTQEEKLLCDFSSPKDTIYISRSDYQYARLPGKHYSYYEYGQMEFPLYKVIDGKVNELYELGYWLEGGGFIVRNPFAFEFSGEKSELGREILVNFLMIGDKCLYNWHWKVAPTRIDDTTTEVILGDSLFDLTGRPLSTPPSRGMYIQNGKKVIK